MYQRERFSFVFAILGYFLLPSICQAGFTPVFNNALISLYDGESSWCDFDMDGDLDIIVTGRNHYNNSYTKFYRNNGNSFTEVFTNQVAGMYYTSVDWGDYDNDGDPDLLITGNRNGNRTSRIYRNNNGNGFTNVYNGQLAGVYEGEAKWGDFDNDGKLDIALTGQTNSGRRTFLYRNTGTGFSQVFSNQIVGLSDADLEWGDVDNDNDLDLVVMGYSNSGPVTRIYRNNGASGFSHASNFYFTGLYNGDCEMADFDKDGDLDLLIAGRNNSANQMLLYKNNGNSFSYVYSGVYAMVESSVDWGDVDNDGDLDIVVNGRDYYWSPKTYVYRFNGNTYTSSYVNQVSNCYNGSTDFGDYDNDGDLDLLITGRLNYSNYFCKIYRNTVGTSNTAPSIPGGLNVSQSNTEFTFSWIQSNDIQTNNNSITYQVRIGTSPGASDVVGKEAQNNGRKWKPERGNAQLGTTYKIKNLSAGTYYWAVQAIDNSRLASAFSVEQSFVVATAPNLTTNTASNIQSNSAVSGGNISNNGGSPVTAKGIVWSTSSNPTLASNLGSTNEGSGTGSFSSTLTNLTQNTVYYIRAYATNSIGTSYGTQKTFTSAKLFSQVFNGSFTNLNEGDVSWCDFDNDGDLDFILTGRSNYYGVTKLYRNNSGSFSSVYNNQIVGVYNSSVDWGDYDNDGDQDLLITGNYYNQKVSKIYRNNGNGFTEVYTNQLTGIDQGEGKWGDFNNDGKLDIVLVGTTNSARKTVLYKNTGSGFTEVFSNQIVGTYLGSVDWGDYDNDNDLDLLISGFSNSSPVTKIYKNNGTSGFSNSVNLQGIYYGEAKWGDLDNDGDLDVLLSGFSNSGAKTRLYRNTNGSFTSVSSGINSFSYSAIDMGDIDNDGDLDAILTGYTSGWSVKTGVYKNNGGNSFSQAFNGQIDNLNYATCEWGDFDGDNDLDLLISGRNASNNYVTKIYKNGTSVVNTAPSTPTGLSVSVGSPNVTLNWNAANDNQTNSGALSYHVRIGTTPGGSNVVNTTATNSGKRHTANYGNALLGTSYTITGLTAGTYYWSVQSIDNSFIASSYAPEQSFVVATPPTLTTNTITNVQATEAASGGVISSDGGSSVSIRGVVWSTSSMPTLASNNGSTTDGSGTGTFSSNLTGLAANTIYYVRAYATNAMGTSYGQQEQFTTAKLMNPITSPVLGVYNGQSSFCDFDMDGDLDIAVTGYNYSRRTRFYRNTNGTYSQVFNGQVISLDYSSIDFGDYDNDGDPDLVITGYNGSTYYSRIYRNNSGSGFTLVYNNQLAGVYQGDAKWGDLNNDGKLDLVITGYSSSGRKTFIYENTGSGFTQVFNNQLMGMSNSSLDLGDYDNDGDLDILIAGQSNSGYRTKLYRNNGVSGFSEVFTNSFLGIYRGEVKFGDLDNDGDLDILVSGYSSSGNRTRVYRNNSGTSFSTIYPNIGNFGYSSVDWGDIDNDGDLDLLINGYTSSWAVQTKIYKNNGNTFSDYLSGQLDGVRNGSTDFGDLDNDGDLDMLISGQNSSGQPYSKIYINGSSNANTAPSVPTGLTANSVIGSGAATLSWNAATDTETANNTLSYHVRIGSSSGASDVVSTMTTVFNNKLLPNKGNASLRTNFTIENLSVGTYYWAVQTIDNGYLNSNFSAEGTFTIEDGIVWDGSSWNNGTGPSSSTGSDNVYVLSGTMPLISNHAIANRLEIKSGGQIAIKRNASITVNDSLVNNGYVEIRNGGSLVQATGSKIGGTGTYKLIRKAGNSPSAYHIWSSPMKDEAILDVFDNNNLYDLYCYDAAAQGWRYDFASLSPTNSHPNSPYTFTSGDLIAGADGIFDIGKGYYATGHSVQKKNFTGTVNNGTILVPIVSTSLGNAANWDGDDWNLVGNPYPSAIDAEKFWRENAMNNNRIDNAIYYWSDDASNGQGYNQYADFATWNMAGGTAASGGGNNDIPNGNISSCQGFWVKSTNTTNLVFNNEMRTTSNNTKFFKTDQSDWEKAWISVTNDQENYNQTLVAFNPNATDQFDQYYDAQKLVGNGQLSFGSVLNGDLFAIQSFPSLQSTTDKIVELSITTQQIGNHIFGLDTLFNLDNYTVYFEDVLKNKSIDLKTGPYAIYIDSTGTYTNRFYLRFEKTPQDTGSTTTGIEEQQNAELQWTYQQDQLWVSSSTINAPIQSIFLYDLNGRALHSNKMHHFTLSQSISTSELSSGVYIVKVILKNNLEKTIRFVKP